MTKTTCDRCGKEIRIDPLVNVRFPQYAITVCPVIGYTKRVDLCSDCQDDLTVWLKGDDNVKAMDDRSGE